jgi:uncharacterized low-complexity protein
LEIRIMSIHTRKSVSIVLGAALLGAASAPAFAMTELANGYALDAASPPEQQGPPARKADDAKAKQGAEGKCGEGKCGSKHATNDTDTDTDDAAKVEDGEKQVQQSKDHAEGKCGEGKCGGSH